MQQNLILEVIAMPQTVRIENDIFADVLNKIRTLSVSQQRFIHEMLAGSGSRQAITQKKLLKKSFGIWAGRTDIKDSASYVNDLRKEWNKRGERVAS